MTVNAAKAAMMSAVRTRAVGLGGKVTEAADDLCGRETVRETTVAGARTTLSLGRRSHGGAWPLAYVVDGRLVTTFPVKSREQVLTEWDMEAPKLRWNAVVPPRSRSRE
ncbi:MAG: hypothetical protein WED09_05525 [Homoserinimonas sp.]